MLSSCACGQVASEDEARIAYAGVDDVVSKSLALGFDGFNTASSANIAACWNHSRPVSRPHTRMRTSTVVL